MYALDKADAAREKHFELADTTEVTDVVIVDAIVNPRPQVLCVCVCVLFCFVLFCFVLFCFVLFYFVLFCLFSSEKLDFKKTKSKR